MRRARKLAALPATALRVTVAAALISGCGFSGSLFPAGGGSQGNVTRHRSTTTTGGVAPDGSGRDRTSSTAGSGAGATTPGGSTTTANGGGTSSTPVVTVTLPGTGRPTIAIGDQNTPEQFILGELYKVALAYEGYSTTLTQNIGTPAISLKALQQGTLDLYPAYLNQWDRAVAGLTRRFRTRRGALAAGRLFAEQHGLALLVPTPFSDTDGIAVTTAFARKNHLRSLHDLASRPTEVSIGTPLEFSQPGGLLFKVERTYSLVPLSTPQIDIGSQYQQLRTGTLQAAFVQTTDWQLSGHSYTVLRDPKHLFGFGNVVPVTTAQVVSAEGPEFTAVINHVDSMLTRHVIQYLNYLIADRNELPDVVATRFLASRGIMPPGGS